jgi:3-methyladenine DNA glycosylase/8-oxoguanine DNA glycosylase
MASRAQEIRTGLAWLHAADPVLAQLIDGHPDFDPRCLDSEAPAEVTDLAQCWRPYRSLASSLLLAAARSS